MRSSIILSPNLQRIASLDVAEINARPGIRDMRHLHALHTANPLRVAAVELHRAAHGFAVVVDDDFGTGVVLVACHAEELAAECGFPGGRFYFVGSRLGGVVGHATAGDV